MHQRRPHGSARARPRPTRGQSGNDWSNSLPAWIRMASVSGRYFADCNEKRPSRHAQDDAMAERLWDVSEAFAKDALA